MLFDLFVSILSSRLLQEFMEAAVVGDCNALTQILNHGGDDDDGDGSHRTRGIPKALMINAPDEQGFNALQYAAQVLMKPELKRTQSEELSK
jgi:hypothetical protein